jgi:hypothetical protein
LKAQPINLQAWPNSMTPPCPMLFFCFSLTSLNFVSVIYKENFLTNIDSLSHRPHIYSNIRYEDRG